MLRTMRPPRWRIEEEMKDDKLFGIPQYKSTLVISAEDKKEAIEKAKKILRYDDIMVGEEKDHKADLKEEIKGTCEIEESPWKDFVDMFMIANAYSPVFIPDISGGSKNYTTFRDFAEYRCDGKIILHSEYKTLKRRLKETEKVDKYNKLKERLLRLAEYLKEDDAISMV